MYAISAKCPLLTQSRHSSDANQCPLLGWPWRAFTKSSAIKKAKDRHLKGLEPENAPTHSSRGLAVEIPNDFLSLPHISK